MSPPEPNEPTADQCERHEKVFETDRKIGYAVWYPQMGGYVGKAVAVMDKGWSENESSRTGGCVDVYVWHNGDFPFHEGENPACIHHCEPKQFIEFGATLAKLNSKGKA